MNDAPKRGPTSFDVARLAGVSRSAVSRTFSGGAQVSEQTREKVFTAAKQLGYRVNSLARGLQGGHSGIVGLVASRLDTPLRSHQVRRLAQALIGRGFRPMLITAEEPAELAGLIDSLLSYSVAGVIVTSDSPPRRLIEDCGELRLPVVLINRKGITGWGDRIVVDPEEAGRIALDMLTDCGARSLGCLMPQVETWSVTGRARAFVAQAGARGLACRIIMAQDQDYDSSRRAVAGEGIGAVDGLFCATDLMAIGALDALRLDLGVAVPGAVQLVGFDDIEQAGWGAYDLSTVRQDLALQTDLAMSLLLDRMQDAETPTRIEHLPLAPVFRATTRDKIKS